MPKIYESRKFGKTIRMSKDEKAAEGKIVVIGEDTYKLTRQLLTYPDGNSIWMFDESSSKKKDETSFIDDLMLREYLERIASSLENIVDFLSTSTVESPISAVFSRPASCEELHNSILSQASKGIDIPSSSMRFLEQHLSEGEFRKSPSCEHCSKES